MHIDRRADHYKGWDASLDGHIEVSVLFSGRPVVQNRPVMSL
jgi:hypothetical protein